MFGSTSAWLGFTGGIVGGAVSATLGQVLVVFRRRYQRRTELKRILTEISHIDQDDIADAKTGSTVDRDKQTADYSAYIWGLRKELRKAQSQCYYFISTQAIDSIDQVIDSYGYLSRDLDQKPVLTDESAQERLTGAAQDALEKLDEEACPLLNLSE